MLSFAELKAIIKAKKQFEVKNIPIYKNGVIYAVSGFSKNSLYEHRKIYYTANIIISDGKVYNLNDVESCKTLVVPKFAFQNGGLPKVTEDLSYVLLMYVCKLENIKISKILVPITYNMMKASPVGYTRKDFMRLVIKLWKDGWLDDGDKLKAQIDNKNDVTEQEQTNDILKRAKLFNTDLVECSVHFATCSECAKLQGRVYSISGKSEKYPKLPDSVLKYGGFHKGCRHVFFPVIEGCFSMSKYSTDRAELVEVDPVLYSNRPFVDDRTEKDKEEYEHYIIKKQNDIDYEKMQRKYYEYKHICTGKPVSLKKYMQIMGFKRIKK
jgi:hypothetical protein|nr:MAG TPA: minor capsid protein [Caudoviricetes sp.]